MNKLKLPLIITAVIISLIFLGVFIINGTQLKALSLEENVKAAKADISVQEQRRISLLYNLVDSVKNYDKHEYETLKAIVDGRGSKKTDISKVGTMLTATAEAYPQLKSDGNYKQLMNELSTTENMIAQVRTNYTDSVKDYNRYVKGWIRKIIIHMSGYEIVEFQQLDFHLSPDAPQNLFGDKEKK